jgi:hypothetical protein
LLAADGVARRQDEAARVVFKLRAVEGIGAEGEGRVDTAVDVEPVRLLGRVPPFSTKVRMLALTYQSPMNRDRSTCDTSPSGGRSGALPCSGRRRKAPRAAEGRRGERDAFHS